MAIAKTQRQKAAHYRLLQVDPASTLVTVAYDPVGPINSKNQRRNNPFHTGRRLFEVVLHWEHHRAKGGCVQPLRTDPNNCQILHAKGKQRLSAWICARCHKTMIDLRREGPLHLNSFKNKSSGLFLTCLP